MPWMVCTCDKRFYAPPSMMTGAKCDDCKKAPQPLGLDYVARTAAMHAEADRERAINATIIDDPVKP